MKLSELLKEIASVEENEIIEFGGLVLSIRKSDALGAELLLDLIKKKDSGGVLWTLVSISDVLAAAKFWIDLLVKNQVAQLRLDLEEEFEDGETEKD